MFAEPSRAPQRRQPVRSEGTGLAVLLSVVIHAVLLGVLYVGLLFPPNRPAPSVRGSVIEAVLVAAPPSSAAPRRATPKPPVAPPPQPEREPKPQQAPTPPQPKPEQPVPKPDTVDQEKAQLLAKQQAEEKARREQAERKRQEQIDLTERQKRQEEAERLERLRKQADEREKQLADIRRLREEAERERRDAEAALAKVESNRNKPVEQEKPDPKPAQTLGNGGTSDDLNGRYVVAITQAILRNWTRPDNMPLGVTCQLNITQAPGGTVVAVSVSPSCPYDELGRRSIEAAVRKAEPLPYRGFESVFNPRLLLNFTPQD